MEKTLSIRVSQDLSKITPSCDVVELSMYQNYRFQNISDFFTWLDDFRFSQESQGVKRFRIDNIRVGNFFSMWSTTTNLPFGMTELQFLEWKNSLLKSKSAL